MSNHRLLAILILIPVVAILAVPIIWAGIYFGLYLGYGNYRVRGHQEFAANGLSLIQAAMEMEQMFSDCRHFVTYGPNDVPLLNSVAYFGDRYVLTMQVAVEIEPDSTGKVIGKPRFSLDEVQAVTVSPSGQVSISFSRNIDFGAMGWQKVYDAGGDFGAIGFKVNSTPAANFDKHAKAARPSN